MSPISHMKVSVSKICCVGGWAKLVLSLSCISPYRTVETPTTNPHNKHKHNSCQTQIKPLHNLGTNKKALLLLLDYQRFKIFLTSDDLLFFQLLEEEGGEDVEGVVLLDQVLCYRWNCEHLQSNLLNYMHCCMLLQSNNNTHKAVTSIYSDK